MQPEASGSAESECESQLDNYLGSDSTAGQSIELESTHTTETHSQCLSSISSDLLQQSSRLGQPLVVTLDMLVKPSPDHPESPASGIIETTHSFLRVLRSLASRPSESTAMFLSFAVTSSTSPVSITPGDSRPPRDGPDPATLLLVLACYIHLLRAYVLLFERICAFLERIADSDDPYLQPVPGLSFGHLPLGTSMVVI